MSHLAARKSAPALEASLAALCRDAGRLSDAAAYVLSAPGKRLRARILLHWVDQDDPALVDAAAAVELLHEGSLCHDDVCDFGLSRRGRPSVAARFGVRCAGLTGALFVGRAIEALARTCLARGIDTGLECLDELALGQLLEVAAPGPEAPRERYHDVVQKKTGTLFRYPAELAARWRGEDPERARAFAQAFALAFQTMDDLADLDSRDASSWPVIDWIETSGDRGAALGRWARGEVSSAEILASGAGERT